MNFKTTIILASLLFGAALALFFSRDTGTKEDAQKTTEKQQKVLGIATADVTKLRIVSSSDKKIALEKSGAAWRLTEPVSAATENFEVDSLIRAIADLESTSIINDATATGLDKPRYTVDITTSDGKTKTL